MRSHPERANILRRIVERVDDLVTDFEDPVFRFVNPEQSSTKTMFAGKGPLYANGRWLAQGKIRATYTALLPETALAEALASGRYFGFPDQNSAPLVFVTAEAKLRRVIDLTDGAIRQRLRISASSIIACDWRHDNFRRKEALTQAWGWALAQSGVEGFLCPSDALLGTTNLVAFPEKKGLPKRLTVTSEVHWPR
jgi:RES domain-containing protein